MPVPTHGLTEKMLQIERRVTEKNQLQAVTCDHTQYGGYSVIQRRRLVIVFMHLDVNSKRKLTIIPTKTDQTI